MRRMARDNEMEHLANRRRFLRLLAGSPLLAAVGVSFGDLLRMTRELRGDERALYVVEDAMSQGERLIATPQEALNVMEFEAVAKKNVPIAHFGYMSTGVDDDATLRANREGFAHYQIRARRLVDVRQVDSRIQLLGTSWETPVVIAPTGSQRAFHPDGELAVARAAKTMRHLMILSTVSTTSVAAVMEARGAPVWFQLYPTDVWEVARALVKRAEAAGCPVLVLTVDLNGGTNRETLAKSQRIDTRQCSDCHAPGIAGQVRHKPMFDGIDISRVQQVVPMGITWDFVKRLRQVTSMKLVIKGLVTREDAQLAVQHGVDAIYVSNHGGRAEESGRATIDSLPEVVAAVAGRVPVLVDGGVRRGTDILKALALGARAVAIARPYLWGLGAFGQPGVEAVLTLLRRELELAMRQAGTTSIAKIRRQSLVTGAH